ncbi:MAG: hypothetical protein U0132_22025 [Gemmatimonadaceae bacterium]
MLSTLALLVAAGRPLSPECRPANGVDPRETLRAVRAALVPDAPGRVLHATGLQSITQDYQSDRSYPPFFSAMGDVELHFDPASGVMRSADRVSYPGYGSPPPLVTLSTGSAVFAVRDTAQVPVEAMFMSTEQARYLNPVAVLSDWSASSITVTGRCMYRDYQRLVLERTGSYGTERLFIDEKTHIPVKLEREEPHYLWGQVRVEFVWTNWNLAEGAEFPTTVFRLVDGDIILSRTYADVRWAPKDSAPSLAMKDPEHRMSLVSPIFLQPLPVDTIRVSDRTYLLRNRGYAQAVVYARDTVFVLDATQGDARARQDSAWIARLYPNHKGIVLVVTDLAHPHIAGLRYWVSRGATVISHEASRGFVQQVVARRWTRTPDALEKHRQPLKFVGIRDSLVLGGGALTLYPIDGIGSEGALMAFSHADRFLWASDYIQQLGTPTQYAIEVLRASERAGIVPGRVAAQHLPLTEWSKVVADQRGARSTGN